MQFRVLLKIPCRAKAFGTGLANVRSLIIVTTHVNHKIRLALVHFVAAFHFALVLPFVLVSIHVLLEMPWTFEGAATTLEQAFVGFGLALVHKIMLRQVRLKFELFPALIDLAGVQSDSHLQQLDSGDLHGS
jgi:hypothetical protein